MLYIHIILIIFFLLSFVNCGIKEPYGRFIDDYILCRWCGSDISSSKHIKRITSPYAYASANITHYGRDNVLVQYLKNRFEIPSIVLTVDRAACVEAANFKWTLKDTWFPGFYWKPCTCAHCKRYVGWVFRSANPDFYSNESVIDDGFYALVTNHIISEHYSDSLMLIPKGL